MQMKRIFKWSKDIHRKLQINTNTWETTKQLVSVLIRDNVLLHQTESTLENETAICKAFELQFSEELERGEPEMVVLFLKLTAKCILLHSTLCTNFRHIHMVTSPIIQGNEVSIS